MLIPAKIAAGFLQHGKNPYGDVRAAQISPSRCSCDDTRRLWSRLCVVSESTVNFVNAQKRKFNVQYYFAFVLICSSLIIITRITNCSLQVETISRYSLVAPRALRAWFFICSFSTTRLVFKNSSGATYSRSLVFLLPDERLMVLLLLPLRLRCLRRYSRPPFHTTRDAGASRAVA